MNPNFNKIDFSVNISIIGGGRWARVMLEVICGIVDKSVSISIYSKRNSTGMSEWLLAKKYEHNILVFEDFPDNFTTKNNAVIVVNAARDHEKSIHSALLAGGNVLVEKPLTVSYHSSEKLILLANKLDKILATAHVFLFASYFIKFRNLISQAGKISTVDIHWEDPGSENRYGEKKMYDSSLPVFSDWLPHVLSMLFAIIPEKEVTVRTLKLKRGGASVSLYILIGDIPCRIILTRNGNGRKRIMSVRTETKQLQLDFSKEPGIIYDESNKIECNREWQLSERPVASMLRAFINGVGGKEVDQRLNVEIGLKALKIIDLTMVEYREKQISWLIRKLISKVTNKKQIREDKDLFYTLSEIFQVTRSLSINKLNEKIQRFLEKLNSPHAYEWLMMLSKKETSVILTLIEEI